jgi:disulfide bond formation protein DsbB
LQRLAMLVIAFGAAMNFVLGPDPRHYGLCLVGALFGLGVSIRQTLPVWTVRAETSGTIFVDA